MCQLKELDAHCYAVVGADSGPPNAQGASGGSLAGQPGTLGGSMGDAWCAMLQTALHVLEDAGAWWTVRPPPPPPPPSPHGLLVLRERQSDGGLPQAVVRSGLAEELLPRAEVQSLFAALAEVRLRRPAAVGMWSLMEAPPPRPLSPTHTLYSRWLSWLSLLHVSGRSPLCGSFWRPVEPQPQRRARCQSRTALP